MTLHSTLHSEVATLPLSFADRGVREVTFRQGFEPETLGHLQFVVRMGLADTEPLVLGAGRGGARGVDSTGAPVSRRVIPRDVLNALLARFPAPEPIGTPQRYEILRTRVTGSRQG